VVVERIDDRAGQHDAGPAPDRDQRRDQTDRSRHPFLGELVADDPERQR
jgi:hypothetical protein